ncbi:MAG: DUF91 domain-containing protein [wastewater metagenome]|nr:DUF91 domain-containing protein [Candidatus Loosdrechtia aerotolerans]
MDEKTLEKILIKYPDLIEKDIKFIGNQVYLKGKKLDILFEDINGQKLVVEVKLVATRKDIAQLLDYAGHILEGEKIPIRVVLAANRIPENFKRSFEYFGIEYIELASDYLLEYLKKKNDKKLINNILNEDLQVDIKDDKKVIFESMPQTAIQSERNLARQNMAKRLKSGRVCSQANHLISFLKQSSKPVFMNDVVGHMKRIGYKSKTYYDLSNALKDCGIVDIIKINGRNAYVLSRDLTTAEANRD